MFELALLFGKVLVRTHGRSQGEKALIRADRRNTLGC